mgnify:CR=1 FL=1
MLKLITLATFVLFSASTLADDRPFFKYKLFADGAEVPVNGVDNDGKCNGGPCYFAVNNVPVGSDLIIKFIPVDPTPNVDVQAAAYVFPPWDEQDDFRVQGGTLENFENTSPPGWRGDGATPPDNQGVEWTANLIPYLENGYAEVEVIGLQGGWLSLRGGDVNKESSVTIRIGGRPVPFIPAYGLWLMSALLGLVGVRRLYKART